VQASGKLAPLLKILYSTFMDLLPQKSQIPSPIPEKLDVVFGPVDLLTPQQRKHWDTVRWLLRSPGRQGRTTVMALAFIAEADENIGTSVRLWDHCPEEQNQKRMMTTVQIILAILQSKSELWRTKEFKFTQLQTIVRIK
jgi:hypothetical protein